ncbi:hypothetical protein PMAYCL1PPCAC_08435, partial [Pristionchus mayeri]
NEVMTMINLLRNFCPVLYMQHLFLLFAVKISIFLPQFLLSHDLLVTFKLSHGEELPSNLRVDQCRHGFLQLLHLIEQCDGLASASKSADFLAQAFQHFQVRIIIRKFKIVFLFLIAARIWSEEIGKKCIVRSIANEHPAATEMEI